MTPEQRRAHEELLRCELRGVWVREGEMRPDKPEAA